MAQKQSTGGFGSKNRLLTIWFVQTVSFHLKLNTEKSSQTINLKFKKTLFYIFFCS